MSRKLTEIHLPGSKTFGGYADCEEVTVEAMVSQVRRYGEHLRAQADEILSAADSDFRIRVVRGVHRQTVLKTLQAGRQA